MFSFMRRYYLQEPQYKKDEKLYLAAPTFVTKADEQTGIVDAFVSVMGNVDLQDDIIHTGSFTKTIQERGTDVRVLDNHNFFSIHDALATCIDISERPRRDLPKAVQEKFPDATGGLFTSSQFMLDDPASLAAFKRVKNGVINQYSIGFQIIKQDWTEENFGTVDEPNMVQIRNIREIRLWEYSLVLFAANPATATAGVKGFIPVTVDGLKRAETKKNCSNCIFFGKFASDIGYCSKHKGTAKTNTICKQYEADETMQHSYADEFESVMHKELTTLFDTWKTNIDLLPSVPAMVEAMTRMLPSNAHEVAYESHETPVQQSDSTTDVAAEDKPLSKTERLALLAEIKARHTNQLTKMKNGGNNHA
jgi:phage head maturation protease